MTVVHTDVADKAVSTEDATDMVHLDAVLTALVESKVEAMKATSSAVSTAPSTDGCDSGKISLGRPKFTPILSSQKRHRHDEHQQHHPGEAESHRMNVAQHHRHRNRRYMSAPHEDLIGELNAHSQQYCHRHRRVSELTRNPEYKRRFSHSQQICPDDLDVGSSAPMELCDLDRFSEFMSNERVAGGSSDSGEYPRLHRVVCSSENAKNLQRGDDVGDDDFITLDIEDELEIDSFNHSESTIIDSQNANHPRSREKRKRRRKRVPDNAMMTRIPEVMMVDRDELPPRARWTIVTTACLLLAMSILLVGVTLRMAPIIDDMVRKENEVLLNSLGQNAGVPTINATMSP